MVRTESSNSLKTGQLAPQFKLKGIDGNTYSLEDFSESKTLLVVFICNHCPYVKARIGDLVELQSKFSKDKLSIVGINSNDPNYDNEGFDNMLKFAKDYNLNFPYLIDESQTIAKLYGAVCTPDPFLFDDSRRLVYHGRINDAVDPETSPKVPIIADNIKKILSGTMIEEDFLPSIGCSIKWIG
ncbi:MAG TPA: thioredoxin family protein [Nitrososphaeraceae archaeon]|nr:thioredoxin family protein [Nitrososphaeraceae archaeon]